MDKAIAMTEVEIAEVGQMFFEQKNWDLFPEVVLKGFNGRPDFIAKRHQLCAAIECKKTLSYPVIEQLTRWRHDRDERIGNKYNTQSISSIPHLLIAITGGNNKPLALLKKEILQQHRIGFYEITRTPNKDEYNNFNNKAPLGTFQYHGFDISYCQWKNYRWQVREIVPPKIQEGSRRTAHKILAQLNNDMKQATAGANGQEGNYMTPFKRTMNAVDTILKRGGEYHITDIMNTLNEEFEGHHYSSETTARSSIPKFILHLGIGTKVSDAPPMYQTI